MIDKLLEASPRYWIISDLGQPADARRELLPCNDDGGWRDWTCDSPIPDRRLPLAVMVLDQFDKQTAATIARVRDLFAEQLIILTTGARELADSLRGLGFDNLGAWTTPAGECWHVFSHDIGQYKSTPDWFGPGKWANPELWDKFRW